MSSEKHVLSALSFLILCIFFSCTKSPTAAPAYLPVEVEKSCLHVDTLYKKGELLYKAEQYDSAAYWFRRAAATARVDSCSIGSWAKARVNMSRNIRLSDLRHGANRAIDTLRTDLEWCASNAPDYTGLFHFHVARALFTMGENRKALPHYEAAAEADRKGHFVTKGSGQYLYLPLGNLYTRLGEYQTAVHILQNGIDSAMAQQDREGTAKLYADLGIAYAAQDKYADAIKAYRLAKTHFDTCRADVDEEEWKINVSGLLSDMSETSLALGDTLQAVQWAQQSLELDPYNAEAWLHAGMLKDLTGQSAMTSEYMAKAEALYAAESSRPPVDREYAKTLLRVAAFPRNTQRLERCQKALSCVIPHFSSEDPFENPDPHAFYPENTIMEGLYLKSSIAWDHYRQYGDKRWLHLADTTAALALTALDTLLHVYDFETSKLYAWKTTCSLAEHRLQILFERFRKGEPDMNRQMMAFSEKNRSVLLRQKIMEEQAVITAHVPAALHDSAMQLQKKVKRLKNLMAEEKAEDKVNPETQKTLTETEIAYRKIRNRMLGYAATRTDSVRMDTVYDLARIRTLLPDTESRLISYFYNPATGKLYIMALGRDTMQCATVSLDTRVAEQFIAEMKNPNAEGREQDTVWQKRYIHTARSLYDTLLAPVLGAAPPHRLIIAPDGILGNLPFDLLLPKVPGPGETTFHRYPYLLRTTAISSVPSASVLLAAQDTRKHHPDQTAGCGYLGVSPAYNGYFTPVRHGNMCTEFGNGLFHGKRLTGFAATKEIFLKMAPCFQLIHFYGHGEANSNDPEHSYIAFAHARERNGAQRESGSGLNPARPPLPATEVARVLYAHEIRQMRMCADLVLLDACETGLGQDAGPEGIFSLSWAFMDAGCLSTVMTLWKVDDRHTALLSRYFLEFLQKGLSKDEALQQAKLAFLEESETALPFYWSGLMLAGDARPLVYRSCGCSVGTGNGYIACGHAAFMLLIAALCLFLLFRLATPKR